jgi:hypothetical protein
VETEGVNKAENGGLGGFWGDFVKKSLTFGKNYYIIVG